MSNIKQVRKVGVVGTGGMGRVHARQYAKMLDVELIAFDADHGRATAYANDTGATIAKTFDDLVRDSDVVDVCLPTHLHLEFATKALRAGKPTLCEKPMCRKVSECGQLVEEAERAGVPFMPAQVVRFFPEYRKAHELVKEGAVGTPGAVRAHRCGRYPKGADLWFANVEQSGGVLMDLAVHDFDWIRWTFGEVRQVFSQALTFLGLTGLDYSLTTLTLESGALAHVEANWAEPTGFRVGFEISGTEGFIEYDNRQTVALRTSTEAGSIPESPMLPFDDPYYVQLRGFLDAVENHQPPPVSAIDGLRAVAICEAAIESAKSGRVVKPAAGQR